MTTRRITPEEAAQWQREIAPQAYTEVVGPSTVSICKIVGDKIDQIGSGVLLEIADKSFIASAAHVLDRAAIHRERLCLPRSSEPGPPLMLDRAGYLVSPVPEGRRMEADDMRDHDPFDVGVCLLEPDDAHVLKQNFRFLRLHQVDATLPLVPAAYVTAGYPSALVDVQNDGRRILPTPFYAVTELCYPLPDGTKHVRLNSIFLSFERNGFGQGFEEITAPRLRGISGGGMWRLANPARLISMWKPGDVMLVGIETSCHPNHYIRGMSIAVVLAMIGTQWPELKSSIALDHERVEFEIQGVRP